jgi:hypothetical protein
MPAGCVAFLAKPLDTRAVLAAVSRLLGRCGCGLDAMLPARIGGGIQ